MDARKREKMYRTLVGKNIENVPNPGGVWVPEKEKKCSQLWWGLPHIDRIHTIMLCGKDFLTQKERPVQSR
jgi:hypothetical protein